MKIPLFVLVFSTISSPAMDYSHFARKIRPAEGLTLTGINTLIDLTQVEIDHPQWVDYIEFEQSSDFHVCRSNCMPHLIKLQRDILALHELVRNPQAEPSFIVEEIESKKEAARYADERGNTLLHVAYLLRRNLIEPISKILPELCDRKNQAECMPGDSAKTKLK